MQQYKDTAAGLGHDNEHARRLWLLIEHTAPTWLQSEMLLVAKDMGLIPKPRMCNDEGEPLFTTSDMAAHLGISIAAAEAAIERLIADRKALGLPVDGLRKAGKLNTLQ